MFLLIPSKSTENEDVWICMHVYVVKSRTDQLLFLLNILMDNIEGMEESSSQGESSCDYEENEVVWAKINGYPWWPAYIGELEEQEQQITVYKVFFFGDNSHSRLNSQKIRKFQNSFALYSLQARKNYKLKLALIEAQQQLKQNAENVSYFDIQNRRKKKAGRKPKPRPDLQPIQNEQKESQNKFNTPEKSEKQQIAQIVVKRRPGRPRKIKPIEEQTTLELKPAKQTEAKDLKKDEMQIEEAKIKEDEQINEAIPTFPDALFSKTAHSKDVEMQSQPQHSLHVLSKSKSDLAIEQQRLRPPEIEKLKRLLEKSNYKQMLLVLHKMKFTPESVTDLLDLRFLPKLERRLGIRQVQKIKLKLKKTLLSKYFKSKHKFKESINLRQLRYDSARAKTVRRIFNIIIKTIPSQKRKEIALQLQTGLKNSAQSNNIEYMRGAIDLISSLHLKSETEVYRLVSEGLSEGAEG